MSSGKKIDTLLYQAPLVINNSKMAVTDLGVFIFFGGKRAFFSSTIFENTSLHRHKSRDFETG